jgi:hypothetical protein
MAFSKWYPLPFQLALHEVLESVGQAGLRTVHCDPDAGWVMAEERTFWMDIGLVDVSVSAHPNSGATVSISAEAYWASNEERMAKAFNKLLWNIDQRINARAHHFAMAVQAAEAQGGRLDLDKGTDLESRRKVMRRPRAKGAIAAGIIVGVAVASPVPFQDEAWIMFLYMVIAAPFFTSACLMAASRFLSGGVLLLVAGIVLGLILTPFTFFLSTLIMSPAIKGATRAFGANHLLGRLVTLSEGSPNAPRIIEIEHR